jgi:hypothetical protein
VERFQIRQLADDTRQTVGIYYLRIIRWHGGVVKNLVGFRTFVFNMYKLQGVSGGAIKRSKKVEG